MALKRDEYHAIRAKEDATAKAKAAYDAAVQDETAFKQSIAGRLSIGDLTKAPDGRTGFMRVGDTIVEATLHDLEG